MASGVKLMAHYRRHPPTVSHQRLHSGDGILVTTERLHHNPTLPQIKVKQPTLGLGNCTIQPLGGQQKRFGLILARQCISLKLSQAFHGGVVVGERRQPPDAVDPAGGPFQKRKAAGYVIVFFFAMRLELVFDNQGGR